MDSIKQVIKNMKLISYDKQESNKIKVCDNFCMFTACLIMAVAVFLQCKAQEARIFNTALLLLGVTSVIHHSRLSKWIINDLVRWLDVILVASVAILGCIRYNWNPLWFFVMLYGVVVIAGGSWCKLIPDKRICIWHASVHIVFIAIILFLELTFKESFKESK